MTDVSLITFSPTGSSLRVAQTFAKELGNQWQNIDLTLVHLKETVCLSPIAIIAVPVYAGRVPTLAVERLQKISSRGAKAITVVVYGNRAYEDALLELNDEVQELGFEIVASAAVVAQHSIVSALGTGRPNEEDLEEIREMARNVAIKINTPKHNPINVPGNRPYREGMKASITPFATEACLGCRSCVTQCPTQAIPIDNPKETDASKCILCMRCVANCPMRARVLPPPFLFAMKEKLASFADIKRENELFI